MRVIGVATESSVASNVGQIASLGMNNVPYLLWKVETGLQPSENPTAFIEPAQDAPCHTRA